MGRVRGKRRGHLKTMGRQTGGQEWVENRRPRMGPPELAAYVEPGAAVRWKRRMRAGRVARVAKSPVVIGEEVGNGMGTSSGLRRRRNCVGCPLLGAAFVRGVPLADSYGDLSRLKPSNQTQPLALG